MWSHRLAPDSSKPTAAAREGATTAFETRDLNFWYGKTQALKNINLSFRSRNITALIGPSGCGKSTFLRCLNRMNDMIAGTRVSGEVLYFGRDIYRPGVDAVEVRRRVGMVFQKPNPFPKSIFDNIAFGLRVTGYKGDIAERVESALRQAALWAEVKDDLGRSGLNLSGGQQQRLCIARSIALEPAVILMDEPCSSLDPIATASIEELMGELAESYTIIIVTHSMQQAARVSQDTAVFHLGEIIEKGDTADIFTRPQNDRTKSYIEGRIG